MDVSGIMRVIRHKRSRSIVRAVPAIENGVDPRPAAGFRGQTFGTSLDRASVIVESLARTRGPTLSAAGKVELGINGAV